MKVIDILENLSDSTNVRVIKDGEIISIYDGRDSIPTEHNDLFIEEDGIRVNNNWLEINCYEMERKWLNVELKGNDAKRFRNYCADMHLKIETSGAGEYTHFEVLCNEEEKENTNNFLNTL